MIAGGTKRLVVLLLATVIAGTGCGDDEGTDPPANGSIAVETITTGNALDDSYSVSIDAVTAGTIGVNETRTFSNQSPGSHSVELTDVANNCAVFSSNPQTANVVSGQTATITFSVQCTQ